MNKGDLLEQIWNQIVGVLDAKADILYAYDSDLIEEDVYDVITTYLTAKYKNLKWLHTQVEMMDVIWPAQVSGGRD